ncbi:MAG: hypothetical protein QM696_09670 [Steroidobacteraceae bacterium]
MNTTTATEPAASTAPSASAPPAAAAMDAAFVERNQIIERYLAGRLPPKGAQDFERFCREHPESLIALGMPERIHAGLRLLETAGQPEPWTEKPPAFWQKPLFLAVLAALAGTLLIATLMLLFAGSERDKHISALEDQIAHQPLSPAESTRSIVVEPSRTGPMLRSIVTLGGKRAEMADLKVDVSWSRFTSFRVTIDRIDQGRVLTLGNLQRDSNGHLRVALNSSVLGPGDYAVQLEGLDWRGTPNKEGWFTFSVAR